MNKPHKDRTQGFEFERLENGDVLLSGENVKEPQIINNGIWASIVLNMTEFSERPNDWQKLMDHHQGRRDIFAEIK